MLGHVIIDKEITAIRSRDPEQTLLNSVDYQIKRKQTLSLENDLLANELREASRILSNENPSKWVEYDFAIADSESQKKPVIYVALSTVLGGVLGALYVLISAASRERKGKLIGS